MFETTIVFMEQLQNTVILKANFLIIIILIIISRTWKPWQSSVNLSPISYIKCSCMLWMNYNSVGGGEIKSLARITDAHCTITETQARPRFLFYDADVYQQWVTASLRWIAGLWCTGAIVWLPDVAVSVLLFFMTTVNSPRSHKVSSRSDLDHQC